MAAILGFMPLLDLRLSIPIKSGRAAKVVPNPATKPTTSDLRKLGSNRLSVSWMANSPQPARMFTLNKTQNNCTLLEETTCTPAFRDSGPDAHLKDVIAPRLQLHVQARCMQVVARSVIHCHLQRIGQPPGTARKITPWQSDPRLGTNP